MADVDMEVDTGHPIDLDIQVDEDLLDFDTDMADRNEVEWAQDEDIPNAPGIEDETNKLADSTSAEENDASALMDHDVDVGVDGLDEMLEDVDNAGHGDVAANPNGTDHPVALDMINAGDGTSITVAQAEESEKQGQEQDDEDARNLPNDDVPAPTTVAAEDNGSTHEIDYEFEDGHGEEEPRKDDQIHVNGGPAADVEEAQDDSIHVKPETQSIQANSRTNDDGDDTIVVAHGQDDQDEITWEAYENNEPQEGEEGSSKETIEESVGADDQPQDEIEVKVASDTINVQFHDEDDEEPEDEDEGTVEEHDADHASEIEVHGAEEEEHVDEHEEEHGEVEPEVEHEDDLEGAHSSSEEQPIVETDFPAITVQYKGDEFPMFSTVSEGFFSETSVLDASIESLLSQLRQELTNEIAHEDELVFQVDELGLEFAESSLKDSLSSVTLRQILEIFDLLVKNHDPDSSRVLYTYLFTKPSTSKRLESLMESAAAGKGLDEVIHLFESPMPNNTSVVEPSSIPQELEELLDEYDSPTEDATNSHEDELHHDEEHQEGDEDTGFPLLEEDHVDPVDALEDGIADDEVPNLGVTEEEVTVEDTGLVLEGEVPDLDENNGKYTTPTPQPAFDCFQPHFCLCPICVVSYVKEHDCEETRFRHTFSLQQALESKLQQRTPLLHRNISNHQRSHSDFSITFSYNEADDILKDQPESELNPFVNFELGDDELDEEVDLENHDDSNDDNGPEPVAATVITTTTSTTTTLRDDNDRVSPDIDLSTDTAAQESAKPTTEDDEDEIAEIDWREQPRDVGETPGTPSGTAKRPRSDDEDAGAEDEQDVKRRRP